MGVCETKTINILLFLQCFVQLVVLENVKNSFETCGDSENGIMENHESIRTKRAVKPFTKFFDQLLGERLFNTTMNFIVPGAKVHLPRHTEEGTVDHLAMQAFFGIFWAAAWLAVISVPVASTYFQPLGLGRSADGNSGNGFHFKWKLTENVTEAIGLNWESCLQKSVCQAHEFPDKYGVLGKAIQVLFPADYKFDNLIHHTETKTILKAARNGAIVQNCAHIYNCFFDVLDVILYIKKYCFATWSHLD